MTRRHDIDALRVLAFALLIAYHIAMLYVAEWGWHLKSTYLSEWLQNPMLLTNRWRMALLFVLSGIAIGLFRPEREPGRFAWSRTWRLLLPLAFGMFFWVAIQAYCQGVANGKVAPGFFRFLIDMWSFKPWPEDAFDGWEYGITWNHLWYLAYVWVYTMILVVALPLLRSRAGLAVQAWFTGLRGWRLVVLPSLVFVLYLNVLLPRFEATNDLIHDWFQHAQFFTVFVFGYWMARDEALWDELSRIKWVTLALALVVFAVYLPIVRAGDGQPEWHYDVARTLRGVYLWTMLLSLLGLARTYLNRPFKWLPYASENVFPWYVLHQTVIIVIAYWLVPLQLGPVVEPVLVVVGTVVGCYALNEYVIARINVLRPLFGLKPRPWPWSTRATPAVDTTPGPRVS